MNLWMSTWTFSSVKVSIKIPSSVLWRWMKVMQFWNSMRVSKRWQIFHLWVSEHFENNFSVDKSHNHNNPQQLITKPQETYTTCLRLHVSRPAWTGKKPQSPQRGTSWLWRASCPWWGWWCSAPHEDFAPLASVPSAPWWTSYALPGTCTQIN